MNKAIRFIGFTGPEFYALLSAFSMPTIIGFNLENKVDASQENYDLGIFSLFKRKILNPGENGFKLEESIGDIFKVLKDAKEILHFKETWGRCREMVLYLLDDKVAIGVHGDRKDEIIMLSLVDKSNALSVIEEAGFFNKDYDVTIDSLDTFSGFVIKGLDEKALKEIL